MKKICFYSPYIPKHFGGGEKYLLECASLLSVDHQVVVAVPQPKKVDLTLYEKYFGLDLSRVSVVASPLGTTASFLTKLRWTQQWDVMYYLTDGSLFLSLAGLNILHIQVPLRLDKSGWIEQLKLRHWHVKNTNSYFTKRVIESSWRTPIDLVHWPLIDTPSTQATTKKEKVIVNVGRFFRQLHSKRQDVLVDIFAELKNKGDSTLKDWKLVLIGAVEDQEYFEEVKAKAADLPVEFYTDLDRSALESWYQRANIYWHATGYEVDEERHPESVEHFGISTVEAMSYGCIPIVINKGGQKEILGDDLKKLLWNTSTECVALTLEIIREQLEDSELKAEIKDRVKLFGKERFETQLRLMIGESPSKKLESLTVSAVIPTYNGRHLLEKNLPAVIKALRAGDELIIVDDASTDDTISWLQTQKSKLTNDTRVKITIISNEKNLRFGASVNRGVEQATGDLILLLNNDVRPQADILEHLIPHFTSSQVFGVGCLEREKGAAGAEVKGGKNTLWFERGMFIHSRADTFTTGETAWVSGGSGLFDRQKWLRLGGFDPVFYPAYWEDIDLSYRARQQGWQVLFEEKAVVDHFHETTNQAVFGSPEITSMSWRNAEKFVIKNGSWWQRCLYWLWRPYWLIRKNSK